MTGVDPSAVLTEVCAALAADGREAAGAILRDKYPFKPTIKTERKPTLRQSMRLFLRDGFIDRYTGNRLVFPATLRLLSLRFPDQFPFQSSWRMDACHIGYWELFPTIDHVVPVARGGADDDSNQVTTSMLRNGAKANFMLEELGWSRHPPGNPTEWDGLVGWFMAQIHDDPGILAHGYIRQWFAAAKAVGYMPQK